jgi:PAS domain-containing protein
VNHDLQKQLAQAFGLDSAADVDALIDALRSGGAVDLQTLRTGCLALVDNVTDRKQMERALSNSLRVLQALLETLPLPVVIRDAERRITLVNAACEKMFGVSREEIVGRMLDSLSLIHIPSPRDGLLSRMPSSA